MEFLEVKSEEETVVLSSPAYLKMEVRYSSTICNTIFTILDAAIVLLNTLPFLIPIPKDSQEIPKDCIVSLSKHTDTFASYIHKPSGKF